MADKEIIEVLGVSKQASADGQTTYRKNKNNIILSTKSLLLKSSKKSKKLEVLSDTNKKP